MRLMMEIRFPLFAVILPLVRTVLGQVAQTRTGIRTPRQSFPSAASSITRPFSRRCMLKHNADSSAVAASKS